MPFVKYEATTVPTNDVKLTATGFSISQAALQAHGLADSDAVNLYWDSDLHLIGITPSTKEDQGAFKITARGNSGKSVTARKFFDRFGIPVEDSRVVSALVNVDGIVAFELALPTANQVKLEYTGKRRGRKPKDALVEECPAR